LRSQAGRWLLGQNSPTLNRSSLVLAYALVGVTAAALALIDIALMLDSELALPDWVLICIPTFEMTYIVVGILAATRRPGSRMGALLVAVGLTFLLSELSSAEIPVLTAVGLIIGTIPLAAVIHLLLAFPSGRLRGRASLVTVLVGYFVCTVMQAPQYLFGFGSEGSLTVLQVYNSESLAETLQWVQWGVGACVTIAAATILWQRWRQIAPEARRRVAPILAYGIFAVLYVPISGRLYAGIGIPDSLTPWALASQIIVLSIIPVAFGFTILSGGFGRTLAIDELAARLEPDGDESMTEALAATLGDPSVELALWVPEREAYVDGLGGVLVVPPLNPNRAAAEVRGAGGERLGAVIYDATLAPDSGLAEAAARVVALKLDRERLAHEVRASAVAARDDERRRLARDLHDGMQTRLLLLAMAANELSEEAKLAPEDRERAKQLERGLVTAADELRTLAHGFLPPALVERGIYAAAEDLAGAYPGVVEHRIPADAERPPGPVETAAYFVVSEALANSLAPTASASRWHGRTAPC
jgi:signal transduction histidine kinase